MSCEEPMLIQVDDSPPIRTTAEIGSKMKQLLEKPYCLLDKDFMLRARSISSFFPEKRVKQLQEAWPMLESCLQEYGISCTLDLTERCMKVSTTKRTKSRYIVLQKARLLLELLSATHVPPSMAVEIMSGRRKHMLIKIGYQKGGLGAKYGIKKEYYLERWNSLFCSLQALAGLIHCNLFLNENTITAFETSYSVSQVQLLIFSAIVENCIGNNLCPVNAVKKHQMLFPVEEPHIMHMESDESDQLLNGLLEASTLCTLFQEKQEKKLKKAWPMVESVLKAHGISCTLSLVDCSMTVSTTRRTTDPYIIDKAGHLLELLSTTHVLPSMAIEILNGSRHHILVKMGFEEDGLCSKFGITKEQFVRRRDCICSSLEELSKLGYCDIFLNENTVAAVGFVPGGLKIIRMIVEDCIVENVCPATAVQDINLQRKRYVRPQHLEDPHDEHLEMDGEYGSPEMTSLYEVFPDSKANKLKEEWPIVKSSLEDCGISCILGDCSITLSKRSSGDLDTIHNAWELLKLLSETKVPAATSIKILEGNVRHDIIKIGLKDGGICSMLGINKERFTKLRRRLKRSLQGLERITKCQLFLNGSTIIAFGTSSTILKQTRNLLEGWMMVQVLSYKEVKRSLKLMDLHSLKALYS